MTRRPLSTKARLAIFQAAGGRCCVCGAKIDGTREKWEVEHPIPIAMGGSDDPSDLRPVHARCHKAKTAQDLGDLAKAKRREARYRGAHRSRNPIRQWRKFDGTPVRRQP